MKHPGISEDGGMGDGGWGVGDGQPIWIENAFHSEEIHRAIGLRLRQ